MQSCNLQTIFKKIALKILTLRTLIYEKNCIILLQNIILLLFIIDSSFILLNKGVPTVTPTIF